MIAVVAQKGGVGKTTVSQCLAVEALRQGLATALIDADPQRSATEWGEQRDAAGIDACLIARTDGCQRTGSPFASSHELTGVVVGGVPGAWLASFHESACLIPRIGWAGFI